MNPQNSNLQGPANNPNPSVSDLKPLILACLKRNRVHAQERADYRQELCLETLLANKDYRSYRGAKFSTYLTSRLNHRLYNCFRKSKRWQKADLYSLAKKNECQIETPIEWNIDSLVAKYIQDPKTVYIILRHFKDDVKLKDLAQELDCCPSTISYRFQQGLQKLKKVLKDYN